MQKKKRMKHRQSMYEVRRKCKICDKIIARGTQHIHNRVKIGRL